MMSIQKQVYVSAKYVKGECLMKFATYFDGSPAIYLEDSVTGEKLCTVSVWIEDSGIEEGEFCVKDWSENEGVVESLIESGVLVDTGMVVPTGHVHAPVCRLGSKS